MYLCTSHSRTHLNCVLYIFVYSSCEYLVVLVVCLSPTLTATVRDASLAEIHDRLTPLTFWYSSSYSATLKLSVPILGVHSDDTSVECMQITNGCPGSKVDSKDVFLQSKSFLISSFYVSIFDMQKRKCLLVHM